MSDLFDRSAAILARDPRVEAVYAFGSRIHGAAGPNSDVDLAVLLNEDLKLMETLRLRATVVETLGRDDVDLVPLNQAPPLLRHEVLASGRRLFARDELTVDRFEERSLREYLDTRHLRDVQRRLARERSRDAAA